MKTLIAALHRVTSDVVDDIKNLQPETVLKVYHATSKQDALEFVRNGIDARKPHHRRYPHHSGGKKLTRGIYVSYQQKVARGFGAVILEFPVMGVNLWPMFPTLMKRDNKMLKDDYPGSYRPAVSHDMLERRQENQALFIGAVPARDIVAIHVYGHESSEFETLSPKEFLAGAEDEGRKHVVGPDETGISLENFVKRVSEENSYSEEEIMEVLKFNMDRAKTKADKRQAVMEVFEPFAPYSVLKSLARRVVK